MRKIIQFKKLNKLLSAMSIIAVLLACQLALPLEVNATPLSFPQQQTDIVWRKLSGTGVAGSTLGTEGTTSYYYIDSNTSYDASSKTAGTSGLIIKGTVYLFIPSGITLSCTGAPGNATAPGGAGIEVNEGTSLYILGSGTLSAKGGNAGNGGNAENGGNASATSLVKGNGGRATLNSGYGGAGGSGGGGAGAGIGSKGATGVAGGSRLSGKSQAITDATSGVYVNSTTPNDGKDSTHSVNAGNIYQSTTITINAIGGSKGDGGKAGSPGKGWLDCGSGWKWYYSAGAGGGGGGGGAGYAAAAIGKGGASGAGGGSGVNGGLCGAASVSYCLRNGQGGTGGAGGTAGATAGYQTSKANNTGFVTVSGGTNDAAINKLTIECWGRLSNGTISHGAVVGGRSGVGGAAGTTQHPSETSYNYSVKFLDRDGTTVEQTDYLFLERTITAPTHCSQDNAVKLLGWQLVNYGNTLSAIAEPLTTAEPSLYSPGSTIQLSKYTYGNITLQAVTEIDYDVALNNVNNSNYSTAPLNNMVENTTGGGLAQKVSGTAPASTLKVILTNQADTVSLYKLADVSWDYTNQVYAKATWVDKVSEWFTHSAYNGSDIASDPLLISDMTATLKSEFFRSLLLDGTAAINGMSPTFTNGQATVSGASDDGETYYTRFENVPAGIYAVVSENSYSPVVTSIVPYQKAPTGTWYLDSEYTARLKHSNVDVNKWINNNDISDTVAYKDTVSFDIEFTFPSFYEDYADRVTLKNDGKNTSLDYKLYAVDTMSPAFELINTSTNKPTITYSINKSTPEAFPPTVDYYEFADETFTGSGDIVPIDNTNYSSYVYNNEYLLDNFEGSTLYAVSKSAPIYTIGEPNVSDDGTTTIRIDFNVHALKAFIKENRINMNKFVMTLHYQATATDKLEIGTDDNTNEIVLQYEVSPSSTTPVEDVVYGYSYGLQVIKIDGTNSTEESKKYLSDAKFKLYKEVKTKPSDMTNVYTYEDAGGDRYFMPVTDIFTDDTSNLEADGVFTSIDSQNGIILKGLKEGKYILEETKAPLGYNTLAEDIYFEINKLEKEDAENHYGGRYQIFKEMDVPGHESTFNESGMMSLTVFNYKGIILPSTGGIGTLIFTLIGIFMMLSVLIILVVKKHARSESYYII